MSMPRTGARSIVVDGVSHRWRIRRRATYSQEMGWSPLTISVQVVDPAARGVLVTDCVVSRPDTVMEPHQTGVTPAMVADMIREARARGWDGRRASRLRVPIARDVIGPIRRAAPAVKR
jgi:hypothetical protein